MIKLIIWDLDDTLWQGTLAEGDEVIPFADRVELLRALNRNGVVSSICSNNEPHVARDRLEALDLWDEFVFPRIAFKPKAEAVADIIADMQLRAPNVAFIDDNPVNLEAVRFHLPDVHVLDATLPETDAFLRDLLDRQRGGRDRRDEYRALESRKRDRGAADALSNEEFLRSCDIRVCTPYLMETLPYLKRIVDMVNRANQLNYTNSRVSEEELAADIINVVRYISFSVYAWDRYGNHGLVGFVMVDKAAEPNGHLKHFVFSCRAMHLGLEQFALEKVAAGREWSNPPFPDLDLAHLKTTFDRRSPDWLTEVSVLEAQDKLQADYQQPSSFGSTLRIGCGCQSTGLQHYSRYRNTIMPDSLDSGHFTIAWALTSKIRPELEYTHIVYMAAMHYVDHAWDGVADLLDLGLYEAHVRLFCAQAERIDTQLLVILPSEIAPQSHYLPHLNLTRERVVKFNHIWKNAFEEFRIVSLLEIDRLHGCDEMSDVLHYYQSSLRKIAAQVDEWYEAVPSRRDLRPDRVLPRQEGPDTGSLPVPVLVPVAA